MTATRDYVLIAEPDSRLAHMFEALACEAKLDVVTTRDGPAARTMLFTRGMPALLVTNLVLPRLDGFALVEDLRRGASPTRTPVMVVSGSMQLRTTAFNIRNKLGIAEILAPGMSANTIRSAFSRALATGPTRPLSPPVPVASAAGSLVTDTSARTSRRLAAIAAMGLVDDLPPDAGLQRLVEDTARSFGVPIALVSLVLDKRQWFKAHVGLSGPLLQSRSTPIEQSFCRHVVDSEVAAPLIVPDARRHPLFSENALVQEGAVGSYAGAPLVTSDGVVLGTLCIVDTKPMAIGYDELDQLMALARRVAGEIELKAKPSWEPQSPWPPSTTATGQDGGATQGLAYVAALLSHFEQGVLLLNERHAVMYANPFLHELLGAEADAPLTRQVCVDRLARLAADPEEARRRLHVQPDGPYAAHAELELRLPTRRVLRWVAKPVRLPHCVAELETFTDITAAVDLAAIDDVAIFDPDESSPEL